ncbi:MAG TPA: hypothetical protein VEJ67_07295 [Candidatus Cybelea sp.]|nr:hypothetical protein [Candidatus Cybelea sp.]
MELTKELDDALKAISKEVEGWPQWQRSRDPLGSRTRDKAVIDVSGKNKEQQLSARAAQT